MRTKAGWGDQPPQMARGLGGFVGCGTFSFKTGGVVSTPGQVGHQSGTRCGRPWEGVWAVLSVQWGHMGVFETGRFARLSAWKLMYQFCVLWQVT